MQVIGHCRLSDLRSRRDIQIVRRNRPRAGAQGGIMTPHALVTAIVTTAFGFALIISSVAGSTSGATGQEIRPLGTAAKILVQPYHCVKYGNEMAMRSLTWNGPCEIAL